MFSVSPVHTHPLDGDPRVAAEHCLCRADYVINQNMTTVIETDRLILRTWHTADLEPMCAINQDPRVMEHFPELQGVDETKSLIDKINKQYANNGYTLYVTELKKTGEFIGFIGLFTVGFEAHFTPATEIGWRLGFNHWGKGYATEGAKGVLRYGFCELDLPEIVSFAVVDNKRSTRVMEKIGLRHNPSDDFDHPNLDLENRLCRHVLYRLTKAAYVQGEKG